MRFGRVALAGILLGGVLPACAGAGAREAAGIRQADGSVRGGAFSVGSTEPEHLMPANATTTADFQIDSALFTGLVAYDPVTAAPRDAMAESITSPDNEHFTIRIRGGWTFHDGEPVTARSFVDAWNFAAYAPNGNGNSFYFQKIAGWDALQGDPTATPPRPPAARTLSGLAVLDDTTFTVTLSAPFSQFPLMLGYCAFYPLPSRAYRDVAAYEQSPVGNGPYEMDGPWRHDEEIRLRRFPGYRGPAPGADRVTVRLYDKDGGGWEDLLGGGLDVATDVPLDQASAARAQFPHGFTERASPVFDYLGFPLWLPAFGRPGVRQAFSLAIDRAAITSAIFDGTRTPARSLVSPVVPGSRPDACGLCVYDPARARRLLTAAGGWHGPLVLWFPQSDTEQPAVEAIANELRSNLGITDIRFRSLEFPQFIGAVKAKRVTGPFLSNWLMDYPSPQSYLAPLFGSGAASNRTGYSDAAVDGLIAAGDSAATIAGALPSYQRAEDRILADMPVVPLWFRRSRAVHVGRVGHVAIDPFTDVDIPDVEVP